MKRLVTALAFLSSVAAAIMIVGGGLALLAIEISGERGTGALLALCGAISFAVAMALIFAKEGAFGEGVWRAAAIAAAIIGAAPPAALAFVAIRFAGFPFRSATPLVNSAVLAIGVFFGLGAISILALGHRRSQESSAPPMVHMQQIRHAQQQLRSAFEASRQRSTAQEGSAPPRVQQQLRSALEVGPQRWTADDDDDIRVRHV